ncbi:hypothetical protein [Pandoraea sputorum]|uniref:Uncharacterized protein n=1 Tax=Pandoraea oxalativorans TaxID=573737 RepID=A0A192B147_9BURK|nr:hypothetical protein [Pandoraea sputorum]ANJ86809.1 hypothetical protein MB84_31565 [Pandoraea oxalativorans]VVE59034.1 hypothetical protein PSP20601_05430 [Pandoraea sputorum]
MELQHDIYAPLTGAASGSNAVGFVLLWPYRIARLIVLRLQPMVRCTTDQELPLASKRLMAPYRV